MINSATPDKRQIFTIPNFMSLFRIVLVRSSSGSTCAMYDVAAALVAISAARYELDG
jgi:hypothetical protein